MPKNEWSERWPAIREEVVAKLPPYVLDAAKLTAHGRKAKDGARSWRFDIPGFSWECYTAEREAALGESWSAVLNELLHTEDGRAASLRDAWEDYEKRATKKTRETQRAERAEAEVCRLSQALCDIVTPGAVHWENRGAYTFGCSRLTGPSGGLFITKHRTEETGRVGVTVELLDAAIQWARTYPGIPSEEAQTRRSAIEHAEILRNKAYRGKEGR